MRKGRAHPTTNWVIMSLMWMARAGLQWSTTPSNFERLPPPPPSSSAARPPPPSLLLLPPPRCHAGGGGWYSFLILLVECALKSKKQIMAWVCERRRSGRVLRYIRRVLRCSHLGEYAFGLLVDLGAVEHQMVCPMRCSENLRPPCEVALTALVLNDTVGVRLARQHVVAARAFFASRHEASAAGAMRAEVLKAWKRAENRCGAA